MHKYLLLEEHEHFVASAPRTYYNHDKEVLAVQFQIK